MMDEPEITISITQIPAAQTPVMDVEDRARRASDNDRVGGADDGADLAVERQERHELGPGVLPQPHDRGVFAAQRGVAELDEAFQRVGLAGGGVDRLEGLGDAGPVGLGGVAEAINLLETGPRQQGMNEAFRGLTGTLERPRVDRQLDEALTRGPDPLHLASVFGLDEATAIRYANLARQLLETAVEQQISRSQEFSLDADLSYLVEFR